MEDLKALQEKYSRAQNHLHGGDFVQARALLQEVYEALAPEHRDVNLCYSLGLAYQRSLGEPAQNAAAALAFFDEALTIDPTHAQTYSNRGIALFQLKRPEDSIASLERAVALMPQEPTYWNNLGNAQRPVNAAQALASYQRAVELAPTFAQPLYNMGGIVEEQNSAHLGLALHYFDKALALEDSPNTRWNRSLALLRSGDFVKGWAEYEVRWQLPELGLRPKDYDRPTWRGEESLIGKTIFVYAEQGYGDILQFCRYVNVLADLGAQVVLGIPPELKSLLQSLKNAKHVIANGEAVPIPFDFHIALASLPFACRTQLHNIPANTPYLVADKNKTVVWRARLDAFFGTRDAEKTAPPRPQKLGIGAGEDLQLPSQLGHSEPHHLRIGIAFSGRKTHSNDAARSIALATFLTFLPQEAAPAALPLQFVCLQKEVREPDQAVLEEQPHIFQASEDLLDFSDTAALIANLDLVISVDSSVLHLAGSLGVPAWCLLPRHAEWRWLLERGDTPWYPNTRLYRQTQKGDWTLVGQRVRADLRAWQRARQIANQMAAALDGELAPAPSLPSKTSANLLDTAQALEADGAGLDVAYQTSLRMRVRAWGIASAANALLQSQTQTMPIAAAEGRTALARAHLRLAFLRHGEQSESVAEHRRLAWALLAPEEELPAAWNSLGRAGATYIDNPTHTAMAVRGQSIKVRWLGAERGEAELNSAEMLLFGRLLLLLSRCGAYITLQVPARWVALASCFAGVKEVEQVQDENGHAALVLELRHLPRLFALDFGNLPFASGYLLLEKLSAALPETTLPSIPTRPIRARAKVRIGVIWGSDIGTSHEQNRHSIPSEVRHHLLGAVAAMRLGSTDQTDQADSTGSMKPRDAMESTESTESMDSTDAAEASAEIDWVDLSCRGDVCEAAALKTLYARSLGLDLIVSVDALAAHILAANQEKSQPPCPIWMLLPTHSHWYWSTHHDMTTPWFRRMRLYRQHLTGDWPDVLLRVRAAILERFAHNLAEPPIPINV